VIKQEPFIGYFTDKGLCLRQEPDPRVIVALKKIKPTWLADTLHIYFDSSEDLSDFPVLRYGFFKTKKQDFKKKEEIELKAGQIFRPLKQLSSSNEFSNVNDLWKYWASDRIDKGIVTSKKSGIECISWNLYQNTDKLFIGNKMLDRTNEFPNVIKELQSIFNEHTVCLQGEIVTYDCGNKLIKSAYLKESGCDEINVDLSGNEDNVVFHINDLIYYDKDLHTEPYSIRLNLIQDILPNKTQFINLREMYMATTPNELINNIKLLKEKGSKEILFKAKDCKYPIRVKENRSSELAILKDINTIPIENVTIELNECPYYSDISICQSDKGNIGSCKLINTFKCKYLSNYYGNDN